MSPVVKRRRLQDGSFIEGMIESIPKDRWRPHGVRYRLAWVQNGICRVLFDNHYGKEDHLHVDGAEQRYHFINEETLWQDFMNLVSERSAGLK